jgi:hypothetical protein
LDLRPALGGESGRPSLPRGWARVPGGAGNATKNSVSTSGSSKTWRDYGTSVPASDIIERSMPWRRFRLTARCPVCDRTERIRHAVSLRRTDMPSQPLSANRNHPKPSPVSSHVTPLCHTAAWPPYIASLYLSTAALRRLRPRSPPRPLPVPTPGMVVAIEGLGDPGGPAVLPTSCARGQL